MNSWRINLVSLAYLENGAGHTSNSYNACPTAASVMRQHRYAGITASRNERLSRHVSACLRSQCFFAGRALRASGPISLIPEQTTAHRMRDA
ncbi:hypothetical protein EV281_11224 [Rhizobium sp. BK418]|nr:hypothetical protein EV281_11224 [Rhizobium sp. BK418]